MDGALMIDPRILGPFFHEGQGAQGQAGEEFALWLRGGRGMGFNDGLEVVAVVAGHKVLMQVVDEPSIAPRVLRNHYLSTGSAIKAHALLMVRRHRGNPCGVKL